MEYLIGGISGAGSVVFTNPIDVLKTRLQLQGELKSRTEQTVHYRGIAQGLYTVAKNDGMLALQKGLVPSMLFAFVMNSLRLGLYRKVDSKGWTRNEQGVIVPIYAMLWSGISGLYSSVLANPFSIVKTRLHSRACQKIAVGKQHKYNGTWNALISIYRNEGIKGYLRGINATVIRVSIGSAGQLSAFSIAKDELLGYGVIATNRPFLLSFVASMFSGIVVAILISPLDVISTRLFNQGNGKERMYNGLFDCLFKIAKVEGLLGFYKGFLPLYLRVAPNTTISLIIWDRLNHYLLE